ncbi:MAG: phosphatidate cytidylyltransferase [bacterium]
MHRQRWISGLLIALGVILIVLFAPLWLFLLIILGLICLAQKEYFALALRDLSAPQKILGFLLSVLVALSFYGGRRECILGIISLLLFVLIMLTLKEKGDLPPRLEKMHRMLLGLLYAPFFLSFFLLLNKLNAGKLWILFGLAAVYGGDIAAFYVGRNWGKKKLAPLISPGKTIEGGIGAVGGSVAGALLFKFLFFAEVPWGPAVIMGLGVGILGQIGDLFESLLKRVAQVKDSGALIPGHGGLLDRIDSVLLSLPWVYFWAWALS